ncbi:N-acetylglucosamine-6-phosphate deacetylase [Neomicrococcus lactis]|uniref:N-acetylglucosamine-6-phosphate deacetylase n=1 Tax=Neomicrococcus lactis TaxID=732241 RepID=A0A7W8Y9L4_9MICC|nr:amidohydrolase family protein [Neomicrococcus lactis]MBB5597437.1 N-acetylglucosamine-6-phosphate deacetylase [Neomicrococcus lactis]
MDANAQTQEPAARYFRGTAFVDGALVEDAAVSYQGDRIVYAGPFSEFRNDEGASESVLAEAEMLIPGLVDLHVHGIAGVDFSTASSDEISRGLHELHKAGTTTAQISLVTLPADQMIAAIENCAAACHDALSAGIHLEGPFLSLARAGAQDRSAILDVDLDLAEELVLAGQGQVRCMTLAPELPQADDLVQLLASHGVLPAFGHTDATHEQMQQALVHAREQLASAGFPGYTEVPLITHLFNGMPPFHHRDSGAVGAIVKSASRKGVVIELIADGQHVDYDVLNFVFGIVQSSNLVIVSDAMAGTKAPDGTYSLGTATVRVTRDGSGDSSARLLHEGQELLAGGAMTLLDSLRATTREGVAFERVLEAMTRIPAGVLGLEDELGRIHRGFRADLVVIDSNFEPTTVIRAGEQVL